MAAAAIVGRETELDTLRRLPRALVLTGGPGIGKTTLWEEGIALAEAAGARVLTARPGETEARFSFSGLADLLERVDIGTLATVPSPQRRALEVALLRADPSGPPIEPWAIGAALQHALRELATDAPLLVAIDDAQWLDAATGAAVAYAARRLAGDDVVRFLVARRSGTTSDLDTALEGQGLERLDVGGLSLGATRRLLFERLGLTLTRRALRRVVEASDGNPLFALELGRAVARRSPEEDPGDMPVPAAVDELLGARVAHLAPAARALLLVVAVGGELSSDKVERLAAADVVADAVAAGVVTIGGDRVRASHPLLAAVARERSTPRERREAHAALAGVASDAESRVRHLTLAADGADAALAADAAAAAAAAYARAALDAAVELGEHALRLTPVGAESRDDRLIALSDYLLRVGEWERARSLLEAEADRMASAASRARAQLALAVTEQSVETHEQRLARALAETADLPELRAAVLAQMSDIASAADVSRIRQAEAWAVEAESLARGGDDPGIFRWTIYSLAWTRLLRGRDIEDLREPYTSASPDQPELYRSIDRLAAIRLVFRGEVEKGRAALVELLALADARGEDPSYDTLRLQLCEAEMRAGSWEAASALLDEWDESPASENMEGVRERCRALVAAGRGSHEEVEHWAPRAIAGYGVHGQRWELLEAQRARGVGALLAHDPPQAAECLRSVWEHTEREGVEDPGAFPVAADLVECLVELGELGEATAVADVVQRRGEEQEHPWALATARRCRSLIRFASAVDEDEAADDLLAAAAAYEELGLRFDRARTLLALGRGQRRRRKWAAARSALEEAVAGFEQLGSPGWVDEARAELDRVGARRPREPGTLTAAQDRVVRLAADGLSNKEIAATLFVTVHTVERHLSNAYVKLGVRSRSQLAGALETRR